ncbi:MAG: YicC/YloC family endoribonuclease [Pseudomonadota bacterium]
MPAVQSMTGFASRDGALDGLTFQLDARSVNGRSLDVRVRLPAGYERFEPDVRKAIAATFKRGSISVTLSVRRAEAVTHYGVNHDQLNIYVDAIHTLAQSGSVAAPRADGLLALRGVIETPQEESVSTPDLSADLSSLLVALTDDRCAEGERIGAVVAELLDRIETLQRDIDGHPERQLPAIKARLMRQIEDLLEGSTGLSAERLHQEAALMATRADVREELDRLVAHVAAARALLAEGGPIGRKLDFLAQEFNRETNTICSKAPHHAITALGLDLKAVVEQLREQVQNLE